MSGGRHEAPTLLLLLGDVPQLPQAGVQEADVVKCLGPCLEEVEEQDLEGFVSSPEVLGLRERRALVFFLLGTSSLLGRNLFSSAHTPPCAKVPSTESSI